MGLEDTIETTLGRFSVKPWFVLLCQLARVDVGCRPS